MRKAAGQHQKSKAAGIHQGQFSAVLCGREASEGKASAGSLAEDSSFRPLFSRQLQKGFCAFSLALGILVSAAAAGGNSGLSGQLAVSAQSTIGEAAADDFFANFSLTAQAAYVEVNRSQHNGPGTTGGTVDLKTNNAALPPAFGGGEVRVLRDMGGAARGRESQQLSMLIRSADGKVIVVDGGVAADSAHLLESIKSLGGYVDAWLITHPQGDHVGALADILQNHMGEIDIRNVYYNFFDFDWYKEVDEGESGIVWVLMEGLEKLPEDRVHGDMRRGSSVTLSDQLSFRVLNDPQQISGAYTVNDSGLMYDITLAGKHLIILGDMGPDGGDRLLQAGVFDGLTADYVQMSHHGQHGVTQQVYDRLKPKACIWPAPAWLYDAQPGNPSGFDTYQTRAWIDELGVKENYGVKNGDVLLK